MYHSHDFDVTLCEQLDLRPVESSAPKWLPLMIVAVGGFYVTMGAVLLGYIA